MISGNLIAQYEMPDGVVEVHGIGGRFTVFQGERMLQKDLGAGDIVCYLAHVLQAANHKLAKAASSEADQRDAARYRWLRDEIEWLPKFYNGWTGPKKGRFDFLWPSDEENLDAAIDAAMSARSGDEGKG